MLIDVLKNYKIFLGSKSPRRHDLLKGAHIHFELLNIDTNEDYPLHLKSFKIPLYLCEKKAEKAQLIFDDKTILITADTIVWLNNKVINKPVDKDDAIRILKTLSGNCHEVYTAVCLKSLNKKVSFYVKSKVYFRKLNKKEILYYVETFKPYDKAGAYGIQEWLGYIAIKKVDGSFYNVMGLPISALYKKLGEFININN